MPFDGFLGGFRNFEFPEYGILEISSQYMRVFGLGFVIELLPDEAAQTQNPYVILIPYYVALYTWLGFLIHAFPFE